MRKKGWLIVLGGLVAVAVIVGVVLWAVCVTQLGPAQACVEEFMVAGQAHDIDGAHALWVPGISRSDIESFVEDYYDPLFEHYESLSTSSWYVETSGGLTTAALEGSISYTDGSTLSYYAYLVKIGGEWKILSIDIGD